MRSRSVGLIAFSVLVITSLLLAACTAPETTPQVVRETVVVTEMVEGTPVDRVITSTPAPEEEGSVPETGEEETLSFLPADGMVTCNPIPEVPEAEAFLNQQASLASKAGQSAAAAARKNTAGKVFGKLASAPVQQDGLVYNVGVFEDVTTLNFWAANGPDNTVWNSYMLPQRLTMYGLTDVTFTLVPAVAAVTEPPALTQDGEFWVADIPIRQDITWSDGEPFTAADVAYTANTVVALGLISGNWSQWYDGNFLERVEAADEYTVRYVFHTRPGLARYEYGILQAPILAEHYWAPVTEASLAPVNALSEEPTEEEMLAAQQAAHQELFAHVPDGEPLAGAFVDPRWEQGAFLDNAAYPEYFDTGTVYSVYENGAYQAGDVTIGTPEGEPLATIEVGPHVDGVVYTIYGTQDAAILALREGEVDFVLNSLGLQRGLADQIRDDPNLTVIDNPTNGYRYLSFNNRRRPMNDCAFRQAVGVLIDKEFVTGTILQGAAYPIYTYIPEGNEVWYTADVPKLGEGLDRQQRLNLAIAILEQAGYTFEGDNPPTYDEVGSSVIPGGRLIMPDGTPVPHLTMIAPSAGYDPLRSTFAIWIETWLNEFGIPVTAELAGFNVLIPRIFTEQDFDMYILGWTLGVFPSSLRDFFSEEQSVTDGNNAGGYISPEFEELSNNILTCTTYEECKDYADQVQVLLATEMPYVVLFDTGIIEAFRSASVEYPYTEQFNGLQFTHQNGALQAEAKVK